MRGRRLAVVSVGAVAVVGALVTGAVLWSGSGAGAAAAPSCSGSAPRLTVTGSGLATGTPDLLTVTLSVSASGSSAQGAMSVDNTATASAVSALTAGGVASKDIQTTGLSLQPDYTEQHGSIVLVGYRGTNDVVAKIHELSNAGRTLDALSAAGGNDVRIQSLAFSVADPRTLEDTARRDAVRQAVTHAAAMAAAAGERLGQVCSLSDQSTAPSVRSPAAQPAYGNAASGSVVPLESGTQQVTANVRIVYALDR